MKTIAERNWKVLTLLFIIVPVSLLATFRLTGVLPEPEGPITIAETKTLDVVKWEFERSNKIVHIGDTVEGLYTTNNLSIVHGILIGDYDEGSSEYGGSDFIDLIVNVTASISDGYIENVNLILQENYINSRINFFEEHQLIRTENLSIANLKDWDKEVFINLTSTNNPKSVYFWAPVHWVLRSPNNQSHQLDVRFEVVYFNSTAYKRVVQPFQLKVGPDNHNSFETALEIQPGTYSRLFLGGYDAEDYFRIYLIQGQRIDVQLNETYLPTKPIFDLYLYDPTRKLKANQTAVVHDKSISFIADSTGYWYIKTRIHASYGFYLLAVSV